MSRLRGTEGYAVEADGLFDLYESVSHADIHRPTMHLMPAAPCRVLDIGAGTGRDAAALAAMGHWVVAVEPVDKLRSRAAVLHPSADIEWIDDGLPELAVVRDRGEAFDLVMLTAVWMHLDERRRQKAMARIIPLIAPGGKMILSLRHGPVPPGRLMFDVSAEETIRLAEIGGLHLLLNEKAQSAIPRRDGVTWTWLAFVKPS